MTSNEILNVTLPISANNQYLQIADVDLTEKQRSDTYEIWYECNSLTGDGDWQQIEVIFTAKDGKTCNLFVTLYAPDKTYWQFQIPFEAVHVKCIIGSTVTLQDLQLYAVVEDYVTLSGVAETDTSTTFTGDNSYSNKYDYVKNADGKITSITRADGTTITVT